MVIEVITMYEINDDDETKKNIIKNSESTWSKNDWKRLLKRKWMFPLLYVGVAITSLVCIFGYQKQEFTKVLESPIKLASEIKEHVQHEKPDSETIEVNAKEEIIDWPIKNNNNISIVTPYYDSKASTESKLSALINYGNEISPHTGIDFRKEDGESFEVISVMDGTVTNIEFHPLYGHSVEIEHKNGIVTIYKSITNIQVKENTKIKRGQLIGNAARNEIEKNQGVHLHFEVRSIEQDTTLNPENILK